MILSSSLKCQLMLLSLTFILGGSYSKSALVRKVSPSKGLPLSSSTLEGLKQSLETRQRGLSSDLEVLGKVEEEFLRICPQLKKFTQELKATFNKIAPLYEAVSAGLTEMTGRSTACRNCSIGSFKCRGSGTCILSAWVCDGDQDCDDGSDEEHCPSTPQYTTSTMASTTATPCSDKEFQCVRSGVCVPKEWRCDSEKDCDDNSDEADCDVVSICPSISVVSKNFGVRCRCYSQLKYASSSFACLFVLSG
ncbi:CD320 antigen-like [Penaeus japonicus]|uniref:CD320 antigen-like n=1 Tax=Penaeus japonicus TaxID=27405 RepID=UPI001C711FC2|nr:CD320 antigen-like [Penaeus japonicus]